LTRRGFSKKYSIDITTGNATTDNAFPNQTPYDDDPRVK